MIPSGPAEESSMPPALQNCQMRLRGSHTCAVQIVQRKGASLMFPYVSRFSGR